MTEHSVALLRELVEMESPTGDTGAIRERLALELAALGAEVAAAGEHLRARFSGRDRPLLLLGHFDTVWPKGTLSRLPWRVMHGNAYGPGSYDMKGGLVVMLDAIRRSGTEHELRVVLTADEEVGSPTAHQLLAEGARGAAAAFVCEPPTASGDLKTARKGIGRFELHVRGSPAHSAHRHEGVSAIDELARLIVRLNELNDPNRGVTLNVGVIAGGTRENVVAAEASALVDVRVPSIAQRDRLDAALRALRPDADVELDLRGSWTRPPLERSAGAAQLAARAHEHGRELGLDLREAAVSGGSDGNLVGALGVPVLDGLGAEGGGAHADDEHVVLSSLEVRAELLARILREPGI